MSNEKSLKDAISSALLSDFSKWAIIGSTIGLLVSGIIGFAVYLQLPSSPNEDMENNYSIRMAEQLEALIPEYEHVKVIGNGTADIHERLIDASFDRIVLANQTIVWNVTAFVLDTSEGEVVGKTISFVLNSNEVDAIAGGLYDSLADTERVGTYGEPPYNYTELPNLYLGLLLFLENNTLISLYILENELVFLTIGSWTTYEQYDGNLLNATILSPASAFEHLINVLHDLFVAHIS